jgi:hypothetical protein
MKTIVVLLAISCVLSLGTAQTFGFEPQGSQEPSYLLEGLGGLAGLGAGAVCGVAAALGFGYATAWATHDGWAGLGAAYVTTLACGLALPACAGYGVTKVVSNTDDERSPAGAYIGAYAGLPVAIGICLLGSVISGHNSTATTTAAVVGTLAIPAGAVVGYNLSSKRETRLYGNRRVGLPLVMLDRVERSDRSTEYGVRVQLASVKF